VSTPIALGQAFSNHGPKYPSGFLEITDVSII